MATKYETERLFITPTSNDDATFILALLNTPGWLTFVGDRNVHTVAEASTYISQRMVPNFEKYGYGNYTLTLKTNNERIGTCGIYNREGLEHCDLGYALLPQHEKNGYINEAATKLIELAFNNFNLTSLQAITLDTHTASKKVLEKLGFSFIEKIFIPNDVEELCLFELGKK